MAQLYQLIIDGDGRGPYTRAECRAEVEALGVEKWHWCQQADGSQLAIDDNEWETLAEAVPV